MSNKLMGFFKKWVCEMCEENDEVCKLNKDKCQENFTHDFVEVIKRLFGSKHYLELTQVEKKENGIIYFEMHGKIYRCGDGLEPETIIENLIKGEPDDK